MPPLDPPSLQQSEGSSHQRPKLVRTIGASRWSALVAVLRRELKAKLLTPGYLWSTIAFAAIAFFTPAVFNLGDDQTSVIAIPPESSGLVEILKNGSQSTWSLREVANNNEAESLVINGEVDAYLAPAANGSWSLVSSETVNSSLLELLQTQLTTHALTSSAVEAGATSGQLTEAVSRATVTPVTLEQDVVDIATLLFPLGIGMIIVLIVMLWGSTMANDVVQEKTTRVVEILLATLRSWQLLAGKILTITIIGILQAAAVILGTWAGLEFFGEGIPFEGIPIGSAVIGASSIFIGVPLLSSFMAAMSARVDHPDDVSTATQPVYLLLMLPFAAVVFLALESPNTIALEILAYAPVTNIFAMPVFATVNDVAPWQLLVSLVVALLTLAASIALAGRIYSSSVLRSGTTVSVREALFSS